MSAPEIQLHSAGARMHELISSATRLSWLSGSVALRHQIALVLPFRRTYVVLYYLLCGSLFPQSLHTKKRSIFCRRWALLRFSYIVPGPGCINSSLRQPGCP